MNEQPICFDMDGVIIDSEPSHFEAFRRTFEPLGISLSAEEYLRYFAGKTDDNGFIDFLTHIGRSFEIKKLQNTKRHHYSTLAETLVVPYSTTVAAIAKLAHHHPLALVTSSPKAQVDAILTRFELQSFFPIRVTAEDISRGKPSPESYLLAADRLARRASECVAVEDAPSGITAAKHAGMYCVAVATSHAVDELTQADRIVTELSADLFDSL